MRLAPAFLMLLLLNLQTAAAKPFCIQSFIDILRPAALQAAADARAIRSLKSWREYSEKFSATTQANILKSQDLYRPAIESGHPHIRFLRQVGYKLEIGTNGQVVAEVPPLETVVRNYERIMRAHVAAGQIKSENVPTLMRVFELDGKAIFLPFGSEIPDGAEPIGRLLTKTEFAEITKRGGLPLGENNRLKVVTGAQSAADHDLAHASTGAQFPEFQTEITAFNARFDSIWRPSHAKFRKRGFYLNELMEGVGIQNRPKLLELFDKHGIQTTSTLAGRPAKTAELAAVLKLKSDAEIRLLLSDIETQRHGLIEKLGGSVRDIVVRHYWAHLAEKYPKVKVVNALVPEARIDKLQKPGTPIDREAVAELMTALENTSHFDFADVVRQSAQRKLNRDSALYVYICQNRLMASLANSYCD